jgi:lysophospholipase L1-like esterase
VAPKNETPSIHALTPIRTVALGDSTTAGTPGFLSPIEAPPAGRGDVTSQYAWWLMRERPDWEVLNRGVNGERSDQIRARFSRDVVDASPVAVVVIAGVNDIYQGRAAADVIEQLRAMYRAAVEAGIAVVAGSIIPFNTATPDQNARMHEVNAWIRRHAEDQARVHFADTRLAVAAAGDPNRLASTPDELHPSPEGYREMARILLPVLDRVISDLTGRTSPA